MFFSSLAAAVAFAGTSIAKIIYAGVNESGGEFGVWSPGNKGFGLPGRFGSTIDTFVDKEKVNIFRVTFLMERLCPLSYGLGSKFNETYFAEYADAINYITLKKGAYAILDPHNYMRYNDPSQQPFSGSVIGNSSDPTAATTKQFQDFWHELAHRFVLNPNVIFGINNEPHDMPSNLLLKNNQAAINGIRSAGALQLILAPGTSWTGGHSWTQNYGDTPSSEFMYKLVDPIHNTAMDVHEYLDTDFSGGHDECSQPGPSNLAALTTWLKKYKLKAILSEFGGANNAACNQAVDDLLKYLAANEEWIGWVAWAAGPIWGTASPCCGADTGSLEPGNTNDLGGQNAFQTVWPQAIRPNIKPKDLKKFGISGLH